MLFRDSPSPGAPSFRSLIAKGRDTANLSRPDPGHATNLEAAEELNRASPHERFAVTPRTL